MSEVIVNIATVITSINFNYLLVNHRTIWEDLIPMFRNLFEKNNYKPSCNKGKHEWVGSDNRKCMSCNVTFIDYENQKLDL